MKTSIRVSDIGDHVVFWHEGEAVAEATGHEAIYGNRRRVKWSVTLTGDARESRGYGYTKAEAVSHAKKLLKEKFGKVSFSG